MAELARVEFEQQVGVLVTRIVGEVDLSNVGDIAAKIVGAIARNDARQVLDLSRTTYLDSTGVQFLFSLATRLATTRQRLDIVVPEGSLVSRVLTLTDVARAIPTHADLAAALAAGG